jgi:hypothetical protein
MLPQHLEYLRREHFPLLQYDPVPRMHSQPLEQEHAASASLPNRPMATLAPKPAATNRAIRPVKARRLNRPQFGSSTFPPTSLPSSFIAEHEASFITSCSFMMALTAVRSADCGNNSVVIRLKPRPRN